MENTMAIELQANTREGKGKGVARKLRAAGSIPAVLYGTDVETPLSLSLDPNDILDLFEQPKGKNVLFDVSVKDGSNVSNVMVKDYDVDPVRRNLLHVDLQAVDTNTPIRVKVPIKPTGRSAGQRLGGILNVIRPNIDVYARPEDIPAEIEISVNDLKVGETILASMVALPEGVAPAFRSDYGLLRVVMPRKRAAELKTEDAAKE